MEQDPEARDILVVDDTPENITLLRDILTHAGHRVRPALSGELALRAARAQTPDLVLLDVMMPGMDGYETCARLKALPALADTPVLFISALHGKGDKIRAFAAGGVDYVEKPFYSAEVLARVQVHLGLRAARGRLARQNAELAAAARTRDEVDALLRHDLKSPLSTILMAAEAIAAPETPRVEVDKLAGYIRDSGWTMLEMIHRSLDLLKMERGEYAVNAAPLDLHACVRRVAAELALSEAGRRAAIRFEAAAGEVWPVRGETLLCRGLFRNLLKNALEASPEGGVVRVSRDGAAGVVLANHGEVPAALRPRLFQKFATAGKVGGSGLGAYSARLMAETQGGSVRLLDAPAGETRILVRLPPAGDLAAASGLHVSPSRSAGSIAHEVRSPSDTAADAAGWRGVVLVADDDPAQAEATALLLAAPGREVVRAKTVAEAVALLCCGDVNAAVLDLEMPGGGGVAVARAHRAAGGRARLIALSAHDAETLRAKAMPAGFDLVLAKPASRGALLQALGAGPSGPTADSGALPADGVGAAMDPDLLPLVPAFLVAREAELRALEAALAGREHERTRVLAHRLRGGFAIYGFAGAAELCRQVEQAALAGDFTAGRAGAEALEATVEALRKRFPSSG